VTAGSRSVATSDVIAIYGWTKLQVAVPDMSPVTTKRSYTPRYVKELPLETLTHQIVRNPQYGGEESGIHGWPIRPIVYRGIKPTFMEALRESLKQKGYRNPIVVYAGVGGDYLAFGGSRIHAGRDVGLTTIPAIVNDYCGRYDDCPEVTLDNFTSFFIDKPKWFVIDDKGADYHYALERKRRMEYDPEGFAWAEDDAVFLDVDFPWVNDPSQKILSLQAQTKRIKG